VQKLTVSSGEGLQNMQIAKTMAALLPRTHNKGGWMKLNSSAWHATRQYYCYMQVQSAVWITVCAVSAPSGLSLLILSPLSTGALKACYAQQCGSNRIGDWQLPA
jgi:hypothetical protein